MSVRFDNNPKFIGRCSICFEPLSGNCAGHSLDERNDHSATSHYFHRECLWKWFRLDKKAVCPRCPEHEVSNRKKISELHLELLSDLEWGRIAAIAAQYKNWPIVKICLEKGEISDRYCDQVLITAALASNIETMKKLLPKRGISPEARGQAILALVRKGNLTFLQENLHGPIDREFFNQSIQVAIELGRIDMKKLLEDAVTNRDIAIVELPQLISNGSF